jgi:group II intron reverse transcriptase/maturase
MQEAFNFLDAVGIPTAADRIAQTVVKRALEPVLDPVFHTDSYGYRPGRSAHQALEVARKRCWRYNWVLDMDIKGFFDNIDHELLMLALRHHTDCRWVLLYIERWLQAPVQQPDGTVGDINEKGTPQGGVISPLLANLFLHYVFDMWMKRKHSDIPFERYADDVICHCRNERQANQFKRELQARLRECKLELHPDKTKIVYCKDEGRPKDYPVYKFDFLGHEFRPRQANNRHTGERFTTFTTAVSPTASKAMRQTIRRWRLHCQTGQDLPQLLGPIRPILNGWISYYGHFNRHGLRSALRPLDAYLQRWAVRKFKRLRGRAGRGWTWLNKVRSKYPDLVPTWAL